MRDYSFGNLISELRMNCGLSQYQLGTLVGVSDKAVSKWENGASKPRINMIKKLSEVLDVSVEDLLTCKYSGSVKDRKDLFAMRKEIIGIAKERMKNIYGDNPAMQVINRFKTEELLVEGRESILWMGFLGKLQEKFRDEDMNLELRDTQLGSSFIAWLLGAINVNPLPAHYYCPICKKVEFVSDEKCGIDLPDKVCTCGAYYHKDGFGINAINIYPFSTGAEIHVCDNGTKMATACLQEFFSGYGEIREIQVIYDEEISFSHPEELKITKLGVLSKEMIRRYPEKVITIPVRDYLKIWREFATLTIVEVKDNEIGYQDLRDIEITKEQIEAFCKYIVESGEVINCSEDKNLEKVILNIRKPKFHDLLMVYGLRFSSGVWKENAEDLYDAGIPLEELISTREDLYDYLYNKFDKKCEEAPSGVAFEIRENVRKGRYTNNRMPVETKEFLLESGVPEWYVESMKKIKYLASKSHLVSRLKREIGEFVELNNL